MPLVDYLAAPMVVDITPTTKTQAIEEMVKVLCKSIGVRRHKPVLDEVLKREESASTYLGMGLALPHARVRMKGDAAVVVGRSTAGIPFDAARGGQAQIVVLLLTNEALDHQRHLQALAEVASVFKSQQIRDAIMNEGGPVNLQTLLGGPRRAVRATRQPRDPIIAAACRLSDAIKAKHIIVFADTVSSDDFIDQFTKRASLVVVCSNKARFNSRNRRIHAVINAPGFGSTRLDQMKIGILLALSRGLLARTDKVVCVSGNPKKGMFDTTVMLDIASEYEFFFTGAQDILPPDVRPEVLERVLGLSAEMALEGREGKPLGTIFVLGDTNTVNGFVRQLIINPFRGYSESERNILDPGLDETIKEFAAIDGAFVITGDGIVLSAGSYLRPQVGDTEALPSGLGARHQAAAGITSCTNALAVTVSESTGMVNLFKSGVILMTISKPVVQERTMVQKML